MKVAQDWGFSVAINPHGPSIRSDDCIRIAGVFLCACTLFRFVDILKPLLSEATKFRPFTHAFRFT
jgi:hypothetical protein